MELVVNLSVEIVSSVLPADNVAVPAVAFEVNCAELVAKFILLSEAIIVEALSVAILILLELISAAVSF